MANHHRTYGYFLVLGRLAGFCQRILHVQRIGTLCNVYGHRQMEILLVLSVAHRKDAVEVVVDKIA